MKSEELLQLGFKPVFVSEEESGSTPFMYYTYDSVYGFEFITDSFDYEGNINDQNNHLNATIAKEKEHEYKVMFFDADVPVRDEIVRSIINSLHNTKS